MVNIENTRTAKLKICPSRKRGMAVTAWVKKHHLGRNITVKFNPRARGFHYCYSKVDGAGGKGEVKECARTKSPAPEPAES